MRHFLLLTLTLAALMALLLLSQPLQADEPREYGLTWWTVDGGGGTLRDMGSRFILSGSIGQPDAGPPLRGGAYTVAGGFWPLAAPLETRLYLPTLLRRAPSR